MNTSPLDISVIIPTYSPSDYLWECLSSLDAQTLAHDRFEVLLVLNGPRAPYWQQISEFISRLDIGVRLLYSSEKGVSYARNLGLDEARGQYLTFIDDDDYVSPAYLEQLLRFAAPNIVSVSYSYAFDESNPHIVYPWEQEYLCYADQGIQPFTHARRNMGGPCMKLFHRDIIASRRFSPRFRNGEDSLFIFLISDRMSSIRFTGTDAVYYRRYRSGSASLSQSRSSIVRNAYALLCEYSRIFFSHRGQYSFSFWFTRILGLIHTILVGK